MRTDLVTSAPRILWRFAFIALIALLVGACAKARSAPPSATNAAPAADAPAASGPPIGRALAVTVHLELAVDDLEAAARGVRSTVELHGGFVANGTRWNDGGGSADFELRVPAADLASVRVDLARLGETSSETERVEDVTEQRADLDARLRNARAEEKRLLDLLGQRTGTLADVIAVERELATVRESIERMDAQSRGIEARIAMATVFVRLEPKALVGWGAPAARIGRAASTGVHAAFAMLVGLSVAALTAGPSLFSLAAVGLAVFLPLRWLARRRRMVRA